MTRRSFIKATLLTSAAVATGAVPVGKVRVWETSWFRPHAGVWMKEWHSGPTKLKLEPHLYMKTWYTGRFKDVELPGGYEPADGEFIVLDDGKWQEGVKEDD